MLVIGLAGHELTARERDWLQHDACAGVILFARNFASKAQVAELSQAIREAAPRPQLVCVDQEGGRVQRFREGYSAFPPLEKFDALYRQDRDAALRLAEEHARNSVVLAIFASFPPDSNHNAHAASSGGASRK